MTRWVITSRHINAPKRWYHHSLTRCLFVHHTTLQVLNSYLTLCCVGTALAAAVFALAIEAKVAFFTFLIAYSTAKVRGFVSRLLLLLLLQL